MRTHELKTDPDVFQALTEGEKTYEIRRDDRGFQVGDILILRETEYSGEQMFAGAPLEYTGRHAVRRVTHALRGPQYGLSEGWVILSVNDPEQPDRDALAARVNELERDISRQAAVARNGMDAARRYSSQMEEKANRLYAECSSDALESEREANAQLTEENCAIAAYARELKNLLEDAQTGLRWFRSNYPHDDTESDEEFDKQVSEVLKEIPVTQLDRIKAEAQAQELIALADLWERTLLDGEDGCPVTIDTSWLRERAAIRRQV
jgi:hypothetical protein